MTPFFNQIQLNVLVEMQDTLNQKTIGLGWIDQNKPFLLAAGMEAAEAIEHHGWKWWKAQYLDLNQLQMELVDILHFVLSEAIAKEDIDLMYRPAPVIPQSSTHLLPVLQKLAGACFKESDLEDIVYYLYAAFLKADMTPNQIYKMYLGKNVLNTFRQNNGYKEGTYIKVWSGKEDNVYLTEILENLNLDSPSIAEDLYKALTAAYEIYA